MYLAAFFSLFVDLDTFELLPDDLVDDDDAEQPRWIDIQLLLMTFRIMERSSFAYYRHEIRNVRTAARWIVWLFRQSLIHQADCVT